MSVSHGGFSLILSRVTLVHVKALSRLGTHVNRLPSQAILGRLMHCPDLPKCKLKRPNGVTPRLFIHFLPIYVNMQWFHICRYPPWQSNLHLICNEGYVRDIWKPNYKSSQPWLSRVFPLESCIAQAVQKRKSPSCSSISRHKMVLWIEGFLFQISCINTSFNELHPCEKHFCELPDIVTRWQTKIGNSSALGTLICIENLLSSVYVLNGQIASISS